jgi:hypothetical protein
VQEAIFKTKERCWSDNGSLWEDATHNLLATPLWSSSSQRVGRWLGNAAYLGPEELRWRGLVGVIRGYMNKPIYIILRHRFSDAFCSFDMNVFVIEVPESLP